MVIWVNVPDIPTLAEFLVEIEYLANWKYGLQGPKKGHLRKRPGLRVQYLAHKGGHVRIACFSDELKQQVLDAAKEVGIADESISMWDD